MTLDPGKKDWCYKGVSTTNGGGRMTNEGERVSIMNNECRGWEHGGEEKKKKKKMHPMVAPTSLVQTAGLVFCISIQQHPD